MLNFDFSWRIAFLIGAGVAIIGILARKNLRETREFVNYKFRMDVQKKLDKNYVIYEELDKKALLGLFFNIIITPVCFYCTYIYLGDFMKSELGMTSKEVINHNFIVSIYSVLGSALMACLCYKFHPIKIIKASVIAGTCILLCAPFYLQKVVSIHGEIAVYILQCAIYIPALSNLINIVGWMKHFPVSRRFTTMATTFGVALALGFATSSYGLIPLTVWFGYYGIWVLFTPVIIGFIWGLNYLKKLEKASGAYDSYPDEPKIKDTALEEGDFKYELDDEYEQFSNKCEYSTELLNKLEALSKEQDIKLNMKVIEKAITFTKKWHSGQMRKTGEHPFYWHPLRVAEMVATHYCKTDVIVASLLHDAIEDSECTMEIIEKEFNHRIAEIVDRLTNKRFEDGVWIKLTLEQTLEKLSNLGDKEAMFIKQMDRYHNLETIEGLSSEKQMKMAEETNNHFIKWIAIIGDKLGVIEKMDLENKMYELDKKILKDNKEN